MLADVKLLPRETAAHIEGFVRGGGIVISDCVPQMDEYKLPMNTMLKLFGMRRSGTNRIIQEGHWVPYITQPAEMAFPPAVDKEKPRVLTDITEGIVNGHSYRFKVASPRSGELERGKIMSSMKSGGFALTRHTVGRGRVYLFGFCLQDTYFQSFRDSCEEDRKQLRGLITDILREEQIYPHIYSSNPDIEATVRANSKEGYVFIINHESTIGETTVDLRDLGFKVGRVTDIETGNAIAFNQNRDTATFQITAPFGTSRLLSVQAEK